MSECICQSVYQLTEQKVLKYQRNAISASFVDNHTYVAKNEIQALLFTG
jgi:hypothetical protein